MYFVTLSPYSGDKPKTVKVEDEKVIDCLQRLNLLSPHKVTILSQDHIQTQDKTWVPFVSLTEELLYSFEKHGFGVEFDTINMIRGALRAAGCTEDLH